MMYKCLDCGHIFDDGEQYVWRESHGEEFTGCPLCGGNYSETSSCKGCGGYFLEDELSESGYCTDCLKNMLTVDEFIDFADERSALDVVTTLEDFMFTEVFGIPAPMVSSEKLKNWLRDTYLRIAANERLLGQPKMQERIDHYMQSVPDLWNDFYEYIDEKGVE